MLVPLLIAAVIGYVLGSLPFGYLVARSHGMNIFEVGSKNPGATNVRRSVGRGAGNLVFTLDALKGAAATFAPTAYRLVTAGNENSTSLIGALGPAGSEHLAVAGLIGALLGHAFSCFTRFRGGKGVATGAGGFAVLFPSGVAIALGVWFVAVAVTRYVSVASMLAAASLPVSACFLHRSVVLVVASTFVAALIVVLHRGNLARIAAGTESRIGGKPVAPDT